MTALSLFLMGALVGFLAGYILVAGYAAGWWGGDHDRS